jgi:hypothetical protein
MSNTKANRPQKPVSPVFYGQSDNFDFETWASLVKRQMIACLRKRGAV